MKRKIISAGMAVAMLLITGILSLTGCRKQPKCGCNGDALDTLHLTHVNITYDADAKTAQFSPIGNPYYIYYFCNPSKWMSTLTKFSQGEEILITGPYFYECNYLMNSSNSYYYNLWRIYQIDVTDVRAYEYGK
jgi:hypothetical protein